MKRKTTIMECPNCWEIPDFDDCPVCKGTRKIERLGEWVDPDMEDPPIPWAAGNCPQLNKLKGSQDE